MLLFPSFRFCRFEISSEDGLVFMGSSPDECHQKLISLINENYSGNVVNNIVNCGCDFFGLSNTTVHYLILSLPGVSKCVKYSFKKFNVRILRQYKRIRTFRINKIIYIYDRVGKINPKERLTYERRRRSVYQLFRITQSATRNFW